MIRRTPVYEVQTIRRCCGAIPLRDRLAEKRRPALIISHPDLPSRLGRVWVAMITSAPPSDLGDIALGDREAAGLPVVSTLRASKVATLDAGRVIRVAGRLSEDDQKLARRALLSCAGF